MNWLQKKNAGVYVNLLASVFAIIAGIAYAVAGTDSYGFVPGVEVLLILGIVSSIAFSLCDFLEFGPVVTMAFYASAFAVFLNSRFMYYAHQYYGIASSPMTGAMMAATIGFAGMILLECIAAFMNWGERKQG